MSTAFWHILDSMEIYCLGSNLTSAAYWPHGPGHALLPVKCRQYNDFLDQGNMQIQQDKEKKHGTQINGNYY